MEGTGTYRKTLMILLVGGFLSLFNETILNIALTDLMKVMRVSATTVQWLATGYMLVVVIMVPLSSFLLRSFSIKKLYLGAMTVFLIGTLICFTAGDFSILLTGRMIQALGTGLLAPIMMAAAVAQAPLNKQGFVMAICTSIILVGPSFGPIFSGIILQLTSWRFLFLLLAILIVLCLIGGWLWLGSPLELTNPPIDFWSIGLIVVGLSSLVYGISIIDSHSSWIIKIGLIFIGLCILAVFYQRQLKLASPLLNIRILRQPKFLAAAILVILMQMVQFSMNVLLPLVLEGGRQLSPLAAALFLFPAAIICALVTVGAGRIYDLHGGKWLILGGLLLMLLSSCWQTTTGLKTPVIVIGILNCLLYFGIGLAWSPNQSVALGSLNRTEQTDGIAIINTFIQLGSALGTPTFIGLLSIGEKTSANQYLSTQQALFNGFSLAMKGAVVIILICLFLALFYLRTIKKLAIKQDK
ncbi:MAG: MFS transporter [Liquorilactobacillus ghanensis]|uniref:MFS transporter n=2 Tax=Liquorilactobacillus ghanensis TaxID=399370 RepID=UPI0039EC4B22